MKWANQCHHYFSFLLISHANTTIDNGETNLMTKKIFYHPSFKNLKEGTSNDASLQIGRVKGS